MPVKPLDLRLTLYLKKHNLTKKFKKQLAIFISNPAHPSLNTEVLEPKSLRLHSFRLGLKYRVIFTTTEDKEVEIVDINNHYQ